MIVEYKGIRYETGNERNDLIELWSYGKFIRVIKKSKLTVIKK
jgi:hypothetical protein